MEYPIEKYEEQATDTFGRLCKIFKDVYKPNAWQIGNVFDTLTDYVFRYSEPTPGGVVQTARDRWEELGTMCWYDDYGWWGIASSKAFDITFANVFGSNQAYFQKVATDCWDVMHTGKPDQPPYKWKGGPNVWDNRDDGDTPGYFMSLDGWAVPRFPGGVWQWDMFKCKRTKPPECSPSNPADPAKCLLGPFQNTVMNGLYLVLALRLAMLNKGTGTVAAAKSELEFLNNWFAVEGTDSLLEDFSGSNLVRERVGTYAFQIAKNRYPKVNGYHWQDFWCGDQGLIFGGLLDYFALDSSDPAVETQAVAIARGVFQHLVDANGVMPYSFGFHDQNDPDDYSCGSGVFWRYMLRAFNQNPALRTEVLNMIASDPEGNPIYKSAEGAFARVKGNNNQLFAYFNVLAVLIAAIDILRQAND